MDDRSFLLRIHLCSGIGVKCENKIYSFMQKNKRQPQLIELAELLSGLKIDLQQFLTDFHSQATTQKMIINQHHGGILTILDPEYPAQLKETFEPPNILFYQGRLELLKRPILAIVGARNMTKYATVVLKKLIPDICTHQITVVSGAARGVDSLAHRLVLNANSDTIAVLGTGLDQVYPRKNYELQTLMARRGLVLTEYELGQKPLPYHFPLRNRIIAGLCQSLLVVEAKHHSGSLITANIALQENRNILAVPGPINSNLSVGTNELIQAGAKPVLNSTDILEDFLNSLTNQT
ncbi:DNA-processing protein DprA [Ligilactobacillus acidipiscis]|uniref:DNA processing protein n=1 Tax=Ligilactobacillus acidipiscis TaxID=89059 RepID=A0A0R2K8G3_9LACO|nr:DNA-processing protein DprA [Ligilactobacillus acidipiscis]KRN85816.1 DNA processing protein [Ligilactobacillus acidipiscis]